MLYAVTIEPLNAIFFVSDRPDDNQWEVQEGVELDIIPLYGTWTPDLGPLHQTLCVSTSDPKHFKVVPAFQGHRHQGIPPDRQALRRALLQGHVGAIREGGSRPHCASSARGRRADRRPTEEAVAAIKRGG